MQGGQANESRCRPKKTNKKTKKVASYPVRKKGIVDSEEAFSPEGGRMGRTARAAHDIYKGGGDAVLKKEKKTWGGNDRGTCRRMQKRDLLWKAEEVSVH